MLHPGAFSIAPERALPLWGDEHARTPSKQYSPATVTDMQDGTRRSASMPTAVWRPRAALPSRRKIAEHLVSWHTVIESGKIFGILPYQASRGSKLPAKAGKPPDAAGKDGFGAAGNGFRPPNSELRYYVKKKLRILYRNSPATGHPPLPHLITVVMRLDRSAQRFRSSRTRRGRCRSRRR